MMRNRRFSTLRIRLRVGGNSKTSPNTSETNPGRISSRPPVRTSAAVDELVGRHVARVELLTHALQDVEAFALRQPHADERDEDQDADRVPRADRLSRPG